MKIIVMILAIGVGTATWRFATAQTPTPITSCGTYSGNLILQNDISASDGCIAISGANTTFDGNGHTITTTNGHVLFAYNKANLTVKNLTSNSDVYIAGESSDNVRIENSNLGGVSIVEADDVVITGNTLAHLYLGQEESDALRATVTNNLITGTSNKLVEIRGSGIVPCAPTNHAFSNNTVTATHTCTRGLPPGTPGACDEPMIVFLWCAAGNTFDHNTFRGTAQSHGLRIRDESDNNTFTNNTIWVSNTMDGDSGAIFITSGNSGKHHPRNNVFRDNLVRSDGAYALNLQSPGYGNLFERNVFWTKTGGIANMFNDGANNNSFLYNTFYNDGSAAAIRFDYRNDRTADTFRNNVFASTGANAVKIDVLTYGRYAGDHNLFASTNKVSSNYPSMANWQSAATPDDVNSIFSDPLFIDAAAGNFHLRTSSPARGLGTNGTDAGAFQFDGSTPPCTENWSCGDWSTCADGLQTRTCTDANNCGTTNGRPASSLACVMPDTTSPAAVNDLRSQ